VKLVELWADFACFGPVVGLAMPFWVVVLSCLGRQYGANYELEAGQTCA
jgi:hypothetical protein